MAKGSTIPCSTNEETHTKTKVWSDAINIKESNDIPKSVTETLDNWFQACKEDDVKVHPGAISKAYAKKASWIPSRKRPLLVEDIARWGRQVQLYSLKKWMGKGHLRPRIYSTMDPRLPDSPVESGKAAEDDMNKKGFAKVPTIFKVENKPVHGRTEPVLNIATDPAFASPTSPLSLPSDRRSPNLTPAHPKRLQALSRLPGHLQVKLRELLRWDRHR